MPTKKSVNQRPAETFIHPLTLGTEEKGGTGSTKLYRKKSAYRCSSLWGESSKLEIKQQQDSDSDKVWNTCEHDPEYDKNDGVGDEVWVDHED